MNTCGRCFEKPVGNQTTLESYFGKHAQEVWERNRMDPDMHTWLLDTKLLKAHVVEYVQSNID